jgi:hypothetical protein
MTSDLESIQQIFRDGVADIRRDEQICASWTPEQFKENRLRVASRVEDIVKGM